VLLSHSAYFKGMLDFKVRSNQEKSDIIKQEVHDYSPKIFKIMLDFMYTGEITVDSNDLIDLL
jgi:hypothetical protein